MSAEPSSSLSEPSGGASRRRSHAERELGLAVGAFPFGSRFLECDGARLHYVDEGRGPVLFFVHGNPTWSFLYRKLIRALSGRFRCIAVDLPGFGLSKPPPGFSYLPEDHVRYVQALLEHLGVNDGTLVAHDWGGPIGLSAALARPGRLTRFVLGNTWGWPVNGSWHFEWFSRLMGGAIGRWGARRFNLFVNGVIPAAMRRGPLPQDVLEAYRAPFQRSGDNTGTHVFPARILQSRRFLAELEAGLKGLDGRNFLFVWPDKDIAFRPAELARWRSLFPQAKVVPMANCGHFPWEEADQDVAQALLAWHPASAGG